MATGLRYLDPSDVRVWRPDGGIHLRLEISGDRTVLNAKIKRAFPLTHPDRLLSVQDAAGKEVGILKSVEGLEPDTRRLVEEEVDRRYFTPRVDKIDSIKLEAGMWRFRVQTQRGPADFFVRNWRDSAYEISPGRWHINSADGARFEIRSLEDLDAESRRLMDQLL